MPTYLYRNALGEEREIVASMKNMPPDYVLINTDGSWAPSPLPGVEKTHTLAPRIFERQVTGGLLEAAMVHPGHEVNYAHQRLPVSASLPRTREKGEVVNRFGTQVRRLKSGAYATLGGDRIVDSRKAADAHAGETGYTRER